MDHVEIYNEGSYIRVKDTRTGVETSLNKANLLIQKDSANTFFFKSDSYILHVRYDRVVSPSSSDITDLIQKISAYNTAAAPAASNIQVSADFKPSMLDALSRLKVSSSPDTTLYLNTTYNKNEQQIDELHEDTTSIHNSNAGYVRMPIESNDAFCIRQSKLYPTHVFGATSTAIVQCTMASNIAASNIVSRVGVFDDVANIDSGEGYALGGNGMFFQWNNSNGLALVYRTNITGTQQDTIVPQGSFNMDRLNGTGASQITFSPSNMYSFVYEWNSVNPMIPARAGIYGRNQAEAKDTIVYCHQFGANVKPFGNPSLPVRWQIYQDSNLGAFVPSPAPPGVMVTGSATIFTDESVTAPTRVFCRNTEDFKTMTSGEAVLCNLTLLPQCNRAKITPKQLNLINTVDGGAAKWSLMFNGSVSGGTYEPVGNGSFASFNDSPNDYITDATSVEVASGYIYGAGAMEINLSQRDIMLLANIRGIPDSLSIVITHLLGTVNVSGGLEWHELE
jgi:hypothetical protein